jgi:hypothetical protein
MELIVHISTSSFKCVELVLLCIEQWNRIERSVHVVFTKTNEIFLHPLVSYIKPFDEKMMDQLTNRLYLKLPLKQYTRCVIEGHTRHGG